MMIQNLTLFASEIETEIQQQQPHRKSPGSNNTNNVNINGIENATANLVLIYLCYVDTHIKLKNMYRKTKTV